MARAERRRISQAAASGLAIAVLTAGCSGGTSTAPDANGTAPSGPSDSTSGSGAPSASPSPVSTLTQEQQQAFEEATEVVLAYRQTITDLYSGARTNLNDLDAVATGELLDQGLMNISEGLREGWRIKPSGGQLEVASSQPVRIRLSSNPQTVKLRVCIDATGVNEADPTGKVSRGVREVLTYLVVRTEHLPSPGWAVSDVTTDSRSAGARRC